MVGMRTGQSPRGGTPLHPGQAVATEGSKEGKEGKEETHFTPLAPDVLELSEEREAVRQMLPAKRTTLASRPSLHSE